MRITESHLRRVVREVLSESVQKGDTLMLSNPRWKVLVVKVQDTEADFDWSGPPRHGVTWDVEMFHDKFDGAARRRGYPLRLQVTRPRWQNQPLKRRLTADMFYNPSTGKYVMDFRAEQHYGVAKPTDPVNMQPARSRLRESPWIDPNQAAVEFARRVSSGIPQDQALDAVISGHHDIVDDPSELSPEEREEALQDLLSRSESLDTEYLLSW